MDHLGRDYLTNEIDILVFEHEGLQDMIDCLFYVTFCQLSNEIVSQDQSLFQA